MTHNEPSALEPVKPPLSAWIWVLAGLSVLLLLGAGVLGSIYLSSRASQEQLRADRAAQIEELTPKVNDLLAEESDLAREYDELSAQREASQAELLELVACPKAIEAWLDSDDDHRPAAARAMFDACSG